MKIIFVSYEFNSEYSDIFHKFNHRNTILMSQQYYHNVNISALEEITNCHANKYPIVL